MPDYKQIEPKLIGRWAEILAMYGIEVPKMRGKNSINHPCPCCGGDDRAHWRDVDGRLSLYCRSCTGDTMKSPESVIQEVCSVSFAEFCNDMAELVGGFDEKQFKQASNKVAASPKRNLPTCSKQDHDKSVSFLESLECVERHIIFDRFSVQYPLPIPAKSNAVFFDVKNESGGLVNVFSVFYDKKKDVIKNSFLAGGVTYGAWHTIPQCKVRKTKGIAWTESVIRGLHHYWQTGQEVRIAFDVMNIVYMCSVGLIDITDDLLISSDNMELLPARFLEEKQWKK